MKILVINSVCDCGSTGRICMQVSTALLSSGSPTVIAFGRGRPITNDGKKIGHKIGSNLNVYVHGFMSRFFDLQGFGSAHSTATFLKWATRFDPDVIWLNNLHGYYINIKELFSWLKTRNSKIFWTLHDCWAFTGHCANYDFVECARWKTGCQKCPYKSSYPRTYISRSSRNYIIKKELFSGVNNMTLITPSNWLKSQVCDSFLSGYKCIVIPNGIDLTSFYPEGDQKRVSENRVILGVSNKWVKEKGIYDFIKLSNFLSANERIVIVGELPNNIVLPNNISHIKKTNSLSELRRIYSSADVFFNPTYQDNFPTVNMEAIACNTPVVTYKTGGATEMVDDRFSVRKGDVYSAYKLMKGIIDGKYQYDFSMRESFSKTILIEKYRKIFLEK